MTTEQVGSLRVHLQGGTDGRGGGTGPLVILMHGFGAPGDDLVGLGPAMNLPREVRFAFPEAPLELGREMGNGRAWWWIDMMAIQLAAMRGAPIDRTNDVPEGMAEARGQLEETIALLRAQLSPSSLVLGGFSQGAMLACDLALRTDLPLAALILFSGTLLAKAEWARLAPKRRGLPVMISHGERDPMVPFHGAEALRDLLSGGGLEVTWAPFRGAHEIPRPAFDAGVKVIRAAITPTGASVQ